MKMIPTLIAAISQVVVKPDSTSWWQATIGPLVGALAGAGFAGYFLLHTARGDREAPATGRSEERTAIRTAEREAYQREVARALIGLVADLVEAEKAFEARAYFLRMTREQYRASDGRREEAFGEYTTSIGAVDVRLIPVVARSEELIDRDLRQRVNVFVTVVRECVSLESLRTALKTEADERPTDAEVAAASSRVDVEFSNALRGVAELSRS